MDHEISAVKSLSVSGDDQHSEDPDSVWEKLFETQVFAEIPEALLIANPTNGADRSPKEDGAVRCVCISDTHGQHSAIDIPPGDILIHAGDFTMCGADFEIEGFAAWFQALPHKHKVVIAGNHDETCDVAHFVKKNKGSVDEDELERRCQQAKAALFFEGCTYLEDSSTEICGIKFYGSPHQPEFNEWAFNLPRGSALREKWSEVPAGVDILLTHGPPLGRGDIGNKYTGKDQHFGCVDLLMEIQNRIRPRFHVFGHVHEGYGISNDGTTVFINAASLDEKYAPVHPAIVFDIKPRSLVNSS